MIVAWLWIGLGCVNCGDGEVGSDGQCVPAACGNGTWGDIEVGSDAVFVSADGPEGGVGTRGRPFPTLEAAVEARRTAGPGMIVVAAGTYPSALQLGVEDDGLRIRGRCSSMVTFDGGTGADPVIDLDGDAEVQVSGITVTGGTGGVHVGAGHLTAEDVVIDEAGWYGAKVESGELDLARVSVLRSVPDADGFSYGVVAEAGATAHLDAVEVGELGLLGVFALDEGTELTMSDSWIHDIDAPVLTDKNGDFEAIANGIYVASGASAQVTDTRIEGVTGFAAALGYLATDPESSLSLERVQIADGRPVRAEDGDGNVVDLTVGIAASEAPGTLDLRDVTITDASWGVLVGDTGELTGPTVSIHNLTVQAGDTLGRYSGYTQLSGHSIEIDGYSVSGPYQYALTLHGSRLDATLSHLDFALEPCVGDFTCAGLSVGDGATAVVSDLVLTRAIGLGMFLGTDADVTIDGSDFSGIEPVLTASGQYAAAGVLVAEAKVDIRTTTFHDSAGIALFAGTGANASLSEVTIRDLTDDYALSGGVWVTSDGETASVDITDCTITGYGKNGVVAYGPGAKASILRTTIQDGRGDGTGEDAGVLVYEQAEVTLTEVAITRPFGAGILVIDDQKSETSDVETVLIAEDVQVTDVAGADGETPVGVVVQGSDARLEAVNLDISGVPGPGLFVNAGFVECAPCTVTDVAYAGVAAYAGAAVVLDHADDNDRQITEISGVASDPVLGGGVGVLALYPPNGLILQDVVVSDTQLAAVYLYGQGLYVIDDSDLEAADPVEVGGVALQGNAVFAGGGITRWDDEADEGLSIGNTDLHDAEDAAILLHGSAATFDRLNGLDDNGVDVVWQGCDETIGEPEGVEEGWTTVACAEGDDVRGYLDPSYFSFYLTYSDPEAQTWE